jgi:hypothetical protein
VGRGVDGVNGTGAAIGAHADRNKQLCTRMLS